LSSKGNVPVREGIRKERENPFLIREGENSQKMLDVEGDARRKKRKKGTRPLPQPQEAAKGVTGGGGELQGKGKGERKVADME